LYFTAPAPPTPALEKPARPKRKAIKNDPRLVAAARELRDRWLEKANDDPTTILPEGKYDVSRALIDPTNPMQIASALSPLPMLALPSSTSSSRAGSTTSTSSGQASSPRAGSTRSPRAAA
jgi:hypothetical protein